jgi:Cof subfamily protein (haloacid dehalogenase superfamily)
MPPTLVGFDLDGTLLTETSELPAAHERAIHELMRMGVQVAIVTGRPLPTALWVQHHLRLTAPLACYNGGWVGHPGREPFAQRPLSGADVRDIIAAVDGLGGALCAYPTAMDWIMDREIVHTLAWREFYGMPIPVVPERFAAWEGTSCKMMYVADPALIPGLVATMRQRFAGRFQVAQSQPDRIEIMPAGIDKAWGLRHLAAHLGVARERVWAVGDADNDREMIAWAGHGCVMGQACHTLRSLARHVLPGVQARGIAALPGLVARSA